MSVALACQHYGEGPPLIVLHGLFGSARNWRGVAQRLGEAWQVHALDLRNHGESPWAESMTYRDLAGDVGDFIERNGLEGAVVLGHSMGGKVAMLLALARARLVGGLIAVDIAPVAYAHSFLPYVDAMQGVDLTAATRRAEVDEQLQPLVPEAPVRGFLVQNLVREAGRLRWGINLGVLADSMATLTAFPADALELAYDGPALFLAGARSGYVRPDHHSVIRRLFPKAEIDAIPEAGHWVHADRPGAFVERVLAFLESTRPSAPAG